MIDDDVPELAKPIDDAEVEERTRKVNELYRKFAEREEQIVLIGLRPLIEQSWQEYQSLQDRYRKLTGKNWEWLK